MIGWTCLPALGWLLGLFIGKTLILVLLMQQWQALYAASIATVASVIVSGAGYAAYNLVRPSDSLLDAVARDDVNGVQRFVQAGADRNGVLDQPGNAGFGTNLLVYRPVQVIRQLRETTGAPEKNDQWGNERAANE